MVMIEFFLENVNLLNVCRCYAQCFMQACLQIGKDALIYDLVTICIDNIDGINSGTASCGNTCIGDF